MSGADARRVRAGRRTVEVRRPGKVLFPGGDGHPEYTKGASPAGADPAGG
ncbi:hypothetical protein SGLAM104S_05755 [Streptomyces glaucescens]